MIIFRFLIPIFFFLRIQSSFCDQENTIELISIIEGITDLSQVPKLTTHMKINNKQYVIVNPQFEQVEGQYKLTWKLSIKFDDKSITTSGNQIAEVSGKGSVGLHVQQFDAQHYEKNIIHYKMFTEFVYGQLQQLLVEKENLKTNIIKSNELNYIYFGSLTQGKNPRAEVVFQTIMYSQQQMQDFKAFSQAFSEDVSDNSFNYAVTNIKGIEDQNYNNYSHNFSISKGNSPQSIIHIETKNSRDILKSNILSMSDVKKGEQSVSKLDLKGESSQGFSEQTSMQFNIQNKTLSIGKGTTLTFTKEYYMNDFKQKGCDMSSYDNKIGKFDLSKDYFTKNY